MRLGLIGGLRLGLRLGLGSEVAARRPTLVTAERILREAEGRPEQRYDPDQCGSAEAGGTGRHGRIRRSAARIVFVDATTRALMLGASEQVKLEPAARQARSALEVGRAGGSRPLSRS